MDQPPKFPPTRRRIRNGLDLDSVPDYTVLNTYWAGASAIQAEAIDTQGRVFWFRLEVTEVRESQ